MPTELNHLVCSCGHADYNHNESGCLECRCGLMRESGLCQVCGQNIDKEHIEDHAKRCLKDLSHAHEAMKPQAYKIEQERNAERGKNRIFYYIIMGVVITSNLLILGYFSLR